ncbi:MAG: hypothetical protein K1X56_09405 [Flavobacteriales bacterium]|nr:hypothetical protein [Flavobacteriales bacterium]
MKNLKFIFTAVVTMLVLSVSAQKSAAPQQHSADERANHRTRKMAAELALNESQLNDVKTLNLEFANKMEEAKKHDGFETEKAKLQATYDSKLQTILSAQQFEKYKQMMAEKNEKRSK